MLNSDESGTKKNRFIQLFGKVHFFIYNPIYLLIFWRNHPETTLISKILSYVTCVNLNRFTFFVKNVLIERSSDRAGWVAPNTMLARSLLGTELSLVTPSMRAFPYGFQRSNWKPKRFSKGRIFLVSVILQWESNWGYFTSCRRRVKILDKTSNYYDLTHTTPGEIGTIVLKVILWFCYSNFSQMCHGV